MDIVSHGLWGALAFGRKNRRSFWLAFGIGLAPLSSIGGHIVGGRNAHKDIGHEVQV